MPAPNDFFDRLLGATADRLLRHPGKILTAYLALAAASGLAAWRWLQFDTNQDNLISNEQEYNRRYLEFLKEFGDLEYLYVVIEVKDLPTAMRLADRVAEEVSGLTQHVDKVFYRVPEEFARRSGLLFLPEELLRRIAGFLAEHQKEVQEFLAVESLARLLEFVSSRLDARLAEADPELAGLALEGLEKMLAGLEQAAAGEPAVSQEEARGISAADLLSRLTEPPLKDLLEKGPWKSLVPRDLLQQAAGQGYFYTGKLLFVQILPKKNFETLEVIREPLRAIREVLERIRKDFPGERIGLTGRPALQADEMETTNRDMTWATVLAILGVTLLFMVFFRALRRPVLTGLVISIAITLTFGIVTATVGHLNLLSIVFAVMLVSLGTEFGIHIIARYQEELHHTGDLEKSLRSALLTAGKGNITSATTTAAAFYTSLLVDFKGLAELGFIAGTGVLVCMAAMNTLLPVLLLFTDRWRLPIGKLAPVRIRFLALSADRPGWTLPAAAALLLAGSPLLRTVHFNSNLLELQAKGLESVVFENLISEKSDFSTWYAAYIADSVDEVRRLVSQLRGPEFQNVIGKTESVLDYLPDDQERKLAAIRQIGANLKPGPGGGKETGGQAQKELIDIDKFSAALEALLDRFDSFLSGALRSGGEGARVLERLTETIDRIAQKVQEDKASARERLSKLQSSWLELLRSARAEIEPLLDPLPLALDRLPQEIREHVVSRRGKFLVYAYPKENIWYEQNMERFIQATRSVDGRVTGVPEQVYESTRLMKRGFILAALYSLVAVFLLIWIDFRSLLFTLLAMVPILLGMLWLLELMPVFNLAFNLANFFAIPIIIGCGVDGGVHIIHRFREDRSAAIATRSTGTAVALSFLTTITGFGMMLPAHHRGVASLGGLMVLGCFTCLVFSVVVLPAILRLVERRRYHEVR
ncbi:MAG: MMPL family transporter [Planctomycetes bacterium]|nr:MMPL family transporter [Planctomycetota bacterium]